MSGLSLKATTQMGVVMSDEDNENDEAFLRSLIRPEEDRRRLHPELPWRGGYRWFRSATLMTGQSPLVRFEAFASALHLSEDERIGAAPTLGVILTQLEIESPIDAVDQVFAGRSDVRRVRRRQLRRA